MTTENLLIVALVFMVTMAVVTFVFFKGKADKLDSYFRQLANPQSLVEKETNVQEEPSATSISSGGYIVFDLPDEKKGLFHDLLRGFEDYAKLRGYIVRFSADNSIPDKMAFKFTLQPGGIAVSTAQVKSDLREYIRKVERNEPLDDLPIILPEPEHNLLLTALMNRIAFLQSTAQIQRNTIDYYDSIFKQLRTQNLGITPAQNFYIQSGQDNQASNYQALNSPQAVQGAQNRLIGNSIDQSIRIATSFNEKEEQIRALADLWMGLYNAEKTAKPEEKTKIEKAVECIRKAENEMKEGEPPEPVRIRKWLETTRDTLKTVALAEGVTSAAKKVLELFNLGC